MLSGWRGLGAFWLAVLVLLGGGGAVLQGLGPPPPPGTPHPQAATVQPPIAAAPPVAAPAPTLPPLVTQSREMPVADRPGRDTPGPIADPDPALLEPMPGSAADMLPRIAEDGRRPMQVYAGGFDRSSRRPRIGILVA